MSVKILLILGSVLLASIIALGCNAQLNQQNNGQQTNGLQNEEEMNRERQNGEGQSREQPGSGKDPNSDPDLTGGPGATIPEGAECSSDDDCIKAGCSGTLCQSKFAEKMFTTCEYREEYACYTTISCGCAQGKCAWRETDAFRSCVEEKRGDGAGGGEIIA